MSNNTFDRASFGAGLYSGAMVHRWFSGYTLKNGMVGCCAWCWPHGSIEMLLPDALLSLPRSHGICPFHSWLIGFTTALEYSIETGILLIDGGASAEGDAEHSVPKPD